MSELFDDLMSMGDSDANIRETYIRSPIPWPGGKFKSLQFILPHLPYRDRFIDVFGGSGTVLLNRRSSRVDVYNDRYSGLVAFYRCMQNATNQHNLIERLRMTVFSREEFIWCKETWDEVNDVDIVERAARWYYMLTCSFGGMGRNFGRQINTPPAIIGNRFKLFGPVHDRYKNVLVENLDGEDCIADFDGWNSVFYVDPPYLDTDGGCYALNFPRHKHEQLLNRIFSSQGYFAVSHCPHPLYDSQKWDHVYEWEITSTIDAKVGTDSNNRTGSVKGNSKQVERLYIKEAK